MRFNSLAALVFALATMVALPASAAEVWTNYYTINTITAEATYIEVRLSNHDGGCVGIFNLYKTHANYQSLSTLLMAAFWGGNSVNLKVDDTTACAEPITKVRVAF